MTFQYEYHYACLCVQANNTLHERLCDQQCVHDMVKLKDSCSIRIAHQQLLIFLRFIGKTVRIHCFDEVKRALKL